jgi:7,8-dihydroneopterin aldolase/epimerase/oxygenase
MAKIKTAGAARPANAAPASKIGRGESRVFVRDLMLTAKIGLHQHERLAQQRIRVNLDLTVADNGPIDDDYDKVVCYGELVTGVRHVVGAGHVNLVETLAERIAEMCLADRRVLSARVRVEKLDVFPEATSVGVEIERFQRRG